MHPSASAPLERRQRGVGELRNIAALARSAGIGVVWKGAKFGRIGMNLVMTIQAIRRQYKESGNESALQIMDQVFRDLQTKETEAMVSKLKEKQGLESVTDSGS